jgi:hypothetical protein
MLTPVWKWAAVLLALDFFASNLDTIVANLVTLAPVTAAITLTLT